MFLGSFESSQGPETIGRSKALDVMRHPYHYLEGLPVLRGYNDTPITGVCESLEILNSRIGTVARG